MGDIRVARFGPFFAAATPPPLEAPAGRKNRLILIMRQSMHDLDVEVLEERIRDAVLLTHAARPARLQDMSFAEPS